MARFIDRIWAPGFLDSGFWKSCFGDVFYSKNHEKTMQFVIILASSHWGEYGISLQKMLWNKILIFFVKKRDFFIKKHEIFDHFQSPKICLDAFYRFFTIFCQNISKLKSFSLKNHDFFTIFAKICAFLDDFHEFPR